MWVRSVCTSDSVAISALASVELSSALARHVREGRITTNQREALFDEFLLDSRTWIVIDLDASMLSDASRICRVSAAHLSLRSLDAVQLTCATRAVERGTQMGIEPGAFVSADRRLLAAAEWAGLPIDNPEDHL